VFDYARWPVNSLRDLAYVVTSLSPQSCLIFGRLKDGLTQTVRAAGYAIMKTGQQLSKMRRTAGSRSI
jgi:hypothetical protein